MKVPAFRPYYGRSEAEDNLCEHTVDNKTSWRDLDIPFRPIPDFKIEREAWKIAYGKKSFNSAEKYLLSKVKKR